MFFLIISGGIIFGVLFCGVLILPGFQAFFWAGVNQHIFGRGTHCPWKERHSANNLESIFYWRSLQGPQGSWQNADFGRFPNERWGEWWRRWQGGHHICRRQIQVDVFARLGLKEPASWRFSCRLECVCSFLRNMPIVTSLFPLLFELQVFCIRFPFNFENPPGGGGGWVVPMPIFWRRPPFWRSTFSLAHIPCLSTRVHPPSCFLYLPGDGAFVLIGTMCFVSQWPCNPTAWTAEEVKRRYHQRHLVEGKVCQCPGGTFGDLFLLRMQQQPHPCALAENLFKLFKSFPGHLFEMKLVPQALLHMLSFMVSFPQSVSCQMDWMPKMISTRCCVYEVLFCCPHVGRSN